ncbi:MalY/PatB family protein [Petrocella sp. FN5]|uniref:MalY/PatB family protein n=1 Tax=Petrocella sp. FN5 TaxID=3032002 RepID=UPI0023D98D51|nr:MalY/PatB family protein [Petrocella sp. FN5]MDF1617890.1 pyridoxal phosphate-dependent aminotransferase [Petrocella sp. FN5]
MIYNFDEIIDRNNTDSLKYDFAEKRGMPEDLLPMWVADMDFRTPEPIIEALQSTVSHGIFGYSESREDYYRVLEKWFLTQFNWQIQSKWLVKTPGVVYAISQAIRAFTEEGDGVLIQEPVYYPFRQTIAMNKRKVVVNQLVYNYGRYEIDFEDFEASIQRESVKLFILCSPHNPVGRVWTKEELIRMGDICLEHGVIIIADEIHSDFTFENITHHVFADLKSEYLEQTITCTAPSKTFNLAGLQISNILIANQTYKKRFKEEMAKGGYSQLNIMGIVACRAAYHHGHGWLSQLRVYLKDNLKYVRSFVNTQLEGVRLVEPEGTYLLWLDFSTYLKKHGLSDQELNQLIVYEGKLWLDDGNMFGQGGHSFQRINMACPRALLVKGMEQLATALAIHTKAIKN